MPWLSPAAYVSPLPPRVVGYLTIDVTELTRAGSSHSTGRGGPIRGMGKQDAHL